MSENRVSFFQSKLMAFNLNEGLDMKGYRKYFDDILRGTIDYDEKREIILKEVDLLYQGGQSGSPEAMFLKAWSKSPKLPSTLAYLHGLKQMLEYMIQDGVLIISSEEEGVNALNMNCVVEPFSDHYFFLKRKNSNRVIYFMDKEMFKKFKLEGLIQDKPSDWEQYEPNLEGLRKRNLKDAMNKEFTNE